MKSWDCWDTLIARRTVKDVHDETDNVFPIAENIAKVRPEDILVSDYYDKAFLQRAIPAIAGLHNKLIVTEDGKQTGRIWPMLRRLGVTEHFGDNPHSDVASPTAYGISGVLSTVAKFTPIEQTLSDAGLIGLARCIREARLTQYCAKDRNLQLLQTQINFPLLFIASIVLHRDHPADRFLLSSRDCFLWHKALEFVRDLHKDCYEVVYFQTSRLARVFPSPSYLRYVRALLPAVIADVGGTGWSLQRLLEHADRPDTPVVLITRYVADELRLQYEAIGKTRNNGNLSVLLRSPAPQGHLEGMNLAAHAMYSDPPQTFNPLCLDWERMPEIQVMHTTFFAVLETAGKYEFQNDIGVADNVLQDQLHECFLRSSQHLHWSQVVQNISAAEHQEVMRRLECLARERGS